MLSKSLIQFFVGGWGCVPSLLFDLRPNYCGGNEGNVTSFKGPMHALLHSGPLTLQQATADPRLRQRLLDTLGQVWVSLLWGHCSFLLGPGAQGSVYALPESVSPVLCEFSWLYVGLMVTSKRAYANPCLPHPEPLPRSRPLLTDTSSGDTQTQFCQSLWGLWVLVHTNYD